MRRKFSGFVSVGAIVGLLVALPLGRTVGAQTTPPSFSSEVELITVDAVVVNSLGRAVPNLTRDDFVVSEEGRPREIVSFEAFAEEPEAETAPAPAVVSSNDPLARVQGRAFALLLDDLHMTATQTDRARETLASFLTKSLRDGDEVTLGTSSGDIWWSARIPEGREDLLAVLARARGREIDSDSNAPDRMTEYEAFWIDTHEHSLNYTSSRPATPVPDPTGSAVSTAELDAPTGSIKARVKKRWANLNVCQEPNCDGQVRGRAAEIETLRQKRTRRTLAVVRRELDAVAPLHGRKSLLLISQGFLEDSSNGLRDVVAATREANTAIYFIDVRGGVSHPAGGSAADAEPVELRPTNVAAFEESLLEATGTEALADESGGFSVMGTNDLAGAAQRIADESRVYYLLGFLPTEGHSASAWRKLRVEVSRPGLVVRARRGYTLRAAAEAKEQHAKKPAEKATLNPAVVRALDSAHDAPAIPLRAKAYVFEPRPKDMARVLVATEFDTSRLSLETKGKSQVGHLEFSIVATHRDTGQSDVFGGQIELTIPEGETPGWRAIGREFDLPPGVAQARVVVRDPVSGAVGSVSHRFEVPYPGGLRVTTPILSDRLMRAAEPADPPRPVVAVHRVFRPEGRLFCQFEVLGAKLAGQAAPRVTADVALRTRTGRLVEGALPKAMMPDASGRLVMLVGMPMEGMTEGQYDLVLTVKDELAGSTIEQREPFALAWPQTATATAN